MPAGQSMSRATLGYLIGGMALCVQAIFWNVTPAIANPDNMRLGIVCIGIALILAKLDK